MNRLAVGFLFMAVPALAQKPKPVATASLIRRACVALSRQPDSLPFKRDSAAALKKLCNLKQPTLNEVSTWAELTKADIPDLPIVARAASLIADETWASARTSVQPFEQASGTETVAVTATNDPFASPSSIIWGFTSFVVDRGREQLQVAVVARLAKQRCAPEQLGMLLQTTCSVLAPATQSGTTTTPGIAALRSAVQTDLRHLPASAATLAISVSKTRGDSSLLDALQIARLGGSFVGDLLDGKGPLDAFSRLASLPPLPGGGSDFSRVATPLATRVYGVASLVASLELDSILRAKVWPGETRSLMALYAAKAVVVNAVHDRPYEWWPGVPFATIPCVIRICDVLAAVDTHMDTVAKHAKAMRDIAATLGRATSDTQRLRLADSLVASTVRLLKYFADPAGDDPRFARVTAVYTGISETAHHIVARDYARAGIVALGVMDTLGVRDKLPSGVPHLLSFASDVAQAESADAVEKSLQHFVGTSSYLDKRAPGSGFYATVNAYAGAATGAERVCAGGAECSRGERFNGAYAPLGFEVGMPIDIPGVRKIIRSVGVFGQLIDVGTLASWRIQHADTSLSNAPTVSAKQIFAPGWHIVLGASELPVTFGFGQTRAPALRKFTKDGKSEDRDAFRSRSLFLAIDIPIYP